MATLNQENTAETQAATGDPGIDSPTWFAPFDSATFLSLQAAVGNRAVGQLLQGEAMQHAHKNNGNGHVQRGLETTTQTLGPEAPFKPLIVDDDAAELEAGQMRKTDFLVSLKSSVCGAVEEVFRNTMWAPMGCPYVERWFSHYGKQSGEHVERALRRYVSQTTRVTAAGDYIPIVTERVRRGLSQWAKSGEMTGEPEDLRNVEKHGVTLQGLGSGMLSGIARAIGSAVSVVVGKSVRRK